MAHRILGLDIGRRAIRVAIVDKSLRQAALTGCDEEPIAADADDATRQDALRRLLARTLRPDDVVALGLPGALVMHRVLTFPFRDAKAITEAVGFELENHIPTPLADLIVDHVQLGFVEGQTEVLAVAAPHDDVDKHLEFLKGAGVDVRRLGLAPLAFASLIKQLPAMVSGTSLLVDVGTRTTEVVVLQDGRTRMLRTLSVGADPIGRLFATQFDTDQGAPDLLASHGYLLPQGATAETTQERTLHDATVSALAPLLRELRQTMSVHQRRHHTRPDRLLLTGGLSRLTGIVEFLEQSLGVPVLPVRLAGLTDVRLPPSQDLTRLGDSHAQAIAQAFAAADALPDQDVDFRQGEFAYEGDFQVLRQRLPQLVAFAVVALCLLGIRSSLTYRALVTEQDQQFAQMQTVSKALTSKVFSGFDELLAELRKESTLDMSALYPDMSAFKVLEEVSAIVDKVTEPPDYVPPGGPGDEPLPRGPELAQGFNPRLGGAGLPDPTMLQHGGAPAMQGVPGLDGSAPVPLPPGGAGMRATATLPDRGMAGDGDADADGDDSGAAGSAAGPQAFTGHKIELSGIEIERTNATLRGDADTQDALLALQQAIDGHRCFGKAKSSSDRITFERHRDWFKFTIQFEIACPAVDDKAAQAKASAAQAKGRADAKAAGKAAAAEGGKAAPDKADKADKAESDDDEEAP